MAVEYEIKLLGIEPQRIRDFLKEEGAKEEETLNFRRVIFDTIPVDPTAWIRLRGDGLKTTLTYKKTHTKEIDGTEEIEVVVDDFEEAKELLTKSGLTSRNYQENIREVYYWMDCQITIDSWPLIDPYVEIEATSKDIVESCLAKFKDLYRESTTDSTDLLYQAQGINLKSIPELKF